MGTKMDGQIQSGDSLFLTNPMGFLGELLVTIMNIGGIDKLTRIGASTTSVKEPISVTLINIPQQFIGQIVRMIFLNSTQKVAHS